MLPIQLIPVQRGQTQKISRKSKRRRSWGAIRARDSGRASWYSRRHSRRSMWRFRSMRRTLSWWISTTTRPGPNSTSKWKRRDWVGRRGWRTGSWSKSSTRMNYSSRKCKRIKSRTSKTKSWLVLMRIPLKKWSRSKNSSARKSPSKFSCPSPNRRIRRWSSECMWGRRGRLRRVLRSWNHGRT